MLWKRWREMRFDRGGTRCGCGRCGGRGGGGCSYERGGMRCRRGG